MKKIFLLSLIAFFLSVLSAHALSFYPIKFNVWTGEAVLSGNSAEIPLYIQNLGLLSDSYSIRTSVPKEYSDNVLIENSSLETNKLKTNDVGNFNMMLTMSSNLAPVKILVSSNTAPIIRYLEVDIKAKPSYQALYFATVVLLAVILLLL
jgi:hypothetical protein